MQAVFYDRKNKRNVKSSELKRIKLVETICTVDRDDDKVETGRRYVPEHVDILEPTTEEDFYDFLAKGYYKQQFTKESWGTFDKEKNPIKFYPHDRVIGELGYKSENCPQSSNWDMWCMLSDLVFLYLE